MQNPAGITCPSRHRGGGGRAPGCWTASAGACVHSDGQGWLHQYPRRELGLCVDLIAEGGSPYPQMIAGQYSLCLAAGKTLDALDTPSEGNCPIFDRRLYRSLGADGTTLTKLEVTAAP